MENTRKIEAYLEGSLGKEELKEFENQAENDKELSELIQLHREVNESIRDKDFFAFRNKLNKIVTGRPILHFKQLIRVAALFVMILAAGIIVKLYFFNGRSDLELFEKYYTRYEPDAIQRSSVNSNSSIDMALMLYESEYYNTCEKLLDSIILQSKNNYLAMFLKGLTCLELQRPGDAILVFKKIPQNWNSPYAIHRDWYFALALLAIQRDKEAKVILKMLIEGKDCYSKKSQSIILKLKI